MKSTVSLELAVDDVLARVSARPDGLRVVRSGSGLEFHTPSGLWIGTVRPDGDGSRFIYRTGPTTPMLRHAVTQANRLLRLLRE